VLPDTTQPAFAVTLTEWITLLYPSRTRNGKPEAKQNAPWLPATATTLASYSKRPRAAPW
jgi:hypothetical protein